MSINQIIVRSLDCLAVDLVGELLVEVYVSFYALANLLGVAYDIVGRSAEALNNREIAYGIWILIFAGFAFSHDQVRRAFADGLNAFAKKVIIVPFSLLVLHTLAITWILSRLGLWDYSQIKNTILWFGGVAVVSFVRIHKIADGRSYFKSTIKDNIRIIVFIEYLINFYSFNLIVELVFVPFVTLIGALLVVSQTDEKFILVQKVLGKLIEVIGITIIAYTTYRLVVDFNDFAQAQTVLDFAVPIALSILLLPLIYVFHVYMVYEAVFIRLQFFLNDEKLRSYAKRSSIIRYKLDLSALNRWADALTRENIVTTNDVDRLHKDIERLQAEEKNPPAVPFDLGWSPYRISLVLEDAGLKVGNYKKLDDDDWFASSPYLEIGDGVRPNNIAYYLEGGRFSVSKLKLTLNINSIEQSAKAHIVLCDIASVLHSHALGTELDIGFKKAIMECGNKEDSVKTKMVRVITEHWPSMRGYSIGFSISNN